MYFSSYLRVFVAKKDHLRQPLPLLGFADYFLDFIMMAAAASNEDSV
jgi:hypothetical protein